MITPAIVGFLIMKKSIDTIDDDKDILINEANESEPKKNDTLQSILCSPTVTTSLLTSIHTPNKQISYSRAQQTQTVQTLTTRKSLPNHLSHLFVPCKVIKDGIPTGVIVRCVEVTASLSHERSKDTVIFKNKYYRNKNY